MGLFAPEKMWAFLCVLQVLVWILVSAFFIILSESKEDVMLGGPENALTVEATEDPVATGWASDMRVATMVENGVGTASTVRKKYRLRTTAVFKQQQHTFFSLRRYVRIYNSSTAVIFASPVPPR